MQLTITIEGSGGPDDVALPAISNLEVVGRPSVSTQVSIVNGRMSQSLIFTYVLRPPAVGTAEVGTVPACRATARRISTTSRSGDATPAGVARGRGRRK